MNTPELRTMQRTGNRQPFELAMAQWPSTMGHLAAWRRTPVHVAFSGITDESR